MSLNYLTELEVKKIEAFCADTEMYDAVRKVILQGLYSHGVIKQGKEHNPLQNGALNLVAVSTQNPVTNEILGEHIRGVWEGLNALESACNTLKSIKSPTEQILSDYNEAI